MGTPGVKGSIGLGVFMPSCTVLGKCLADWIAEPSRLLVPCNQAWEEGRLPRAGAATLQSAG